MLYYIPVRKAKKQQLKTWKNRGLVIGALFLLYLVSRPLFSGNADYVRSALADADGGAMSSVNSQTLYLPQPTLTRGIGGFDDEDDTNADQIAVYVVRKGETLSEIAHMYGVTEYTIRKANDLGQNEPIIDGMHLTILPISIEEPVAKPIKKSTKSVKILPNKDSFYTNPLPGYRRTQGLHGHNGVDLVLPEGSPVLAAAEGDVLISKNNSGYNGGYGNYIVIAHTNGTQTLYGHLLKSSVGVGEHVTQGQVIGLLGDTGKSTGPHLHFEVRGARNPF